MSSETRPQSKEQLLTAIDHEWNALLLVAGNLTERQMLTPDEGGWSPKDNLIHLAEWMVYLMGHHMDGVPRHDVIKLPEEITREGDFDIMNRALFERNKDRSIEDVMAEIKRVYADLISKLKTMPFEELLKPRYTDAPEKGILLDWVLGDTTEHFAEHRETIEKVL
jgi:hypothetical protein